MGLLARPSLEHAADVRLTDCSLKVKSQFR